MSKVMMITGASRGIGAATAKKAAHSGFKVCINYLYDDERASRLSSCILSAGGECMLVKADATNPAGVELLFDECERTLGEVDVLVNNVGVIAGRSSFTEISYDRFMACLTSNVGGYFLCSQRALQTMIPKKSGVIINISSAASRLGSAGEYVDYAVSKGAVDALSIGMSKELSRLGIRVNCVRPGFINTEIHERLGDPERLSRLSEILPARRRGEAEEIANMIAWLASSEASYTHGCFIDMAGGL